LAIIEALEKRDPDLAEKRMRSHIEGLARYIEEKVHFPT
jgi:DNA-binding GntR family transcriptional regulator